MPELTLATTSLSTMLAAIAKTLGTGTLGSGTFGDPSLALWPQLVLAP